MGIEYEHSFNVKSIVPYIEYCNKNGYKEISKVTQNRIVYENYSNRHVIMRLTTETINGEEVTVLDAKNVGEQRGDLNISRESEPFVVTKEMKESVLSMLSTLEFYEAANNYRTRYVYEKNGVKFEIDDYIKPQMKVVAIEGEKEEVDKVYNELLEIILKEKE